jgi:JmjC domain, hydroxylase
MEPVESCCFARSLSRLLTQLVDIDVSSNADLNLLTAELDKQWHTLWESISSGTSDPVVAAAVAAAAPWMWSPRETEACDARPVLQWIQHELAFGEGPAIWAEVLLDDPQRIDALGQWVADRCAVNDESCSREINRRHASELSRNEFVTEYMEANRPVLIEGLVNEKWFIARLSDDHGEKEVATRKQERCAWLMRQTASPSARCPSWEQATRSKLPADAVHHVTVVPNFRDIARHYGADLVSVQQQAAPGFFPSPSCSVPQPARPRLNMTLSQYAAWWQQHHDESEEAVNGQVIEEQSPVPLWYLKDWKFLAAHPNMADDGLDLSDTTDHSSPRDVLYEWPIYFRNDWLNQAMPAYKFVYIGPAGSTTGLHVDVLQSHSWSTNICGYKEWYLVPPHVTPSLYQVLTAKLAPHFHADGVFAKPRDDDEAPPLSFLYPGLAWARHHAIHVIQGPGETIFVPAQWHHTVENLTPCCSVNHNWLNYTNVRHAWSKIRREMSNLKKYQMPVAQDVPMDVTARDSSVILGIEGSREVTGGSCNDAINEQDCQNSNQSQVGSEFSLLWHVLLHRAKSVMSANLSEYQQSGTNGIFGDLPTCESPTLESGTSNTMYAEQLRDALVVASIMLDMIKFWSV